MPVLEVLTWNVNRRPASALRSLEEMAERLDVLTLQEVRRRDRADFVSELTELGLAHVLDGGDGQATGKPYGTIIASRCTLVPQSPPPGLPFPALVAHAQVEISSEHHLEVITVHAPNGSNNGWDKIRTLEAVRYTACTCSPRPLVLTGDFNEPRYIPNSVPVRSFAWTGEETWDKRRLAPWTRRRGRGASETRSRDEWDDAVAWYFDETRSGLRHAYWVSRGIGSMAPTYMTTSGTCRERWFDHVLVSKGVEVLESRYLHELRAPVGPSDHSGFRVKISVG